MSNYVPGSGLKKPLNMIQSPVYPDIKQSLPEFKWSGKHWNVDVGKTMIDTEANTQLLGDAVLARSYNDNVDRYGKSSHQEKITVFRPPLQNSYEDFQSLSRLPAKIYNMPARINPSTITDNGTTGFRANNTALQEPGKYLTDRITTDSWYSTYYSPIDLPTDLEEIRPDLETVLPSHSVFSGFVSPVTKDTILEASVPLKDKSNIKETSSQHSGYNNQYTTRIEYTVPYGLYKDNLPITPMHSGFTPTHTIDGNQQFDFKDFENNIPSYSLSSGYNPSRMIDGETQYTKIEFDKNIPEYSLNAGYNNSFKNYDNSTTNVEHNLQNNLPSRSVTSGFTSITNDDFRRNTQVDNMVLQAQLDPRIGVSNPFSETGFQTRIDNEGFTRMQDHVKKMEMPKIPLHSGVNTGYKENQGITQNQIHVRSKLQPAKSYDSNLGQGTILRSGPEIPNIGGRFIKGMVK